MKNQKIFIFCALLCITLLCACFSTWDGSGGTGKVALKNPGTPGVEEYTVILTSPGHSSIESEPTRGSIIVIDVPPGTWNIEVREEGPEGLTALGDAQVEVKPGETKEVPVTMYPAAQVNKKKTFSDAFNYFEGQDDIDDYVDDPNIENNSLCYVEITESITVDDIATLSGRKNITLRADKNVTITRGTGGTLFQINGGSKLTLGGVGQGTIIIEGNDTSGNESLIKVSGTLVMHEGVILTDNTASGNSEYNENNGGGVYVDNGGKFFMEGGTISNNYSDPKDMPNDNAGGGGGVYVHTGGAFTMKNGLITENKTTGHGGGVRVYEGGTFTMDGGTISKNEVDSTNSLDNGGGIRVRGTFTMNGGTISGNEAPSGGGVSVGDSGNGSGTFTMNDGTISGNKAKIGHGGGVHVDKAGTFTKTGGTIYGNNNNNLQNTAIGNGQAVYAQSGNTTKLKNTTAGPGNNLSSSPNGIFSEGWDQ
jgi:hypothetical protein